MFKNYILARELRKNQTISENKVWQLLRNRRFYNLKFKRQCPIGAYIVDFVCKEKKIIIEIDGGQHNENYNITNDIKRTKYLENLGYKVIRFWNNDVQYNISGVLSELKKACIIASSPSNKEEDKN